MIQFQAIEVQVPSLGTQPPWAHMPELDFVGKLVEAETLLFRREEAFNFSIL